MENNLSEDEQRWNYLDKKLEEIAGAQKDYQKFLNEFKERLKSGELKSDDHIKAFTTIHLTKWDDETTSPFRELERKVNENPGKEVLVIKSTKTLEDPVFPKYAHLVSESPENHHGIMSVPKYYETTMQLNLGRISSNLELNLQTGQIIIPTFKTLSSAIASYSDFDSIMNFPADLKWVVSEKPIIDHLWDLPHLLNKEINSPYNFFQLSGFKEIKTNSQILFDKEIPEYFAKAVGGTEFYQKANETIKELEQCKVKGL